jgi:arylsulfatase B
VCRIVACVFLALAAGMLSGRSRAAEPPPNIVIVVADDLGWADVSFHGDQIKTPNLDRLVAEGAELSRFYVCPVCSPTRAGLMTGRYPIRFGLMRAVVPPWRAGGLDTAEVTLPEVLARAGYRHRGIFGKWHLGHSDIRYHPLRRGFTEFIGHYNGAIDYFTHQREGELDWHRDYEANYDQGYSTDLIADAAVQFIQRHANDAVPFLCYVPFNAPHGPLQAKQEDLETYRHLADALPKFPRRAGQIDPEQSGVQGQGISKRQTLAAMISSLDQGLGRILQTLQDAGISDRTLVWFFSDNGGVAPGDNRPLRGAKASVFEGGIRVTAAVCWPGKIPPGSRVEVPLAYIDVLPTLMRVAGLPSNGGRPLDGVDALDVLTGEQTQLPRDLYSYIGQGGEDQEQLALMEPEWKLVVRGAKLTEADLASSQREIFLFRIADDPYETADVAGEHPDVVRRMLAKLAAFRALQPADAVPPYGVRPATFTPPPEWKIPE